MLQLLAEITGFAKDPIPPESSLDDFVDRVQSLLVRDPYSSELRRLRRFATRNKNPQFLECLDAKIRLFEQQQRELRPSGALASALFNVEKTLGAISDYRRFSVVLVMAIAASVGGSQFFSFADAEYDSEVNAADIGDPFSIRIADSESNAAEEPVDRWIQQQLLLALRTRTVQNEMRAMIAANATVVTLDQEETAIQSAIERILTTKNLSDTDKEMFQKLLRTTDFVSRLKLELSNPDASKGEPPIDSESNNQFERADAQ